MSDCNLRQKPNKEYLCVPNINLRGNFYNRIKGKIVLENSEKGKISKILNTYSGASKSEIHLFNYNGNEYISYIESYKIPKNLNSDKIDPKKFKFYKFDGEEEKNLQDLDNEIQFYDKVYKHYPKLVPAIVSCIFFKNGNNLIVQVITESAHNDGFGTLGDYIDDGYLDLRFKQIDIPGVPEDENLKKYFKIMANKNPKIKRLNLDFYSAFLNPKYLKENLNKWYAKTKHFFIPFFRSLHKLHKIDVFHHDLHAKNIWVKKKFFGKYEFKFIDFGRSSNLKESLEITFPAKLYKSTLHKLQHAEKKKIKTISNKKKFMLAELNYPDKIKYENIMQDLELLRHDIDQAILLNSLGKDKNVSVLLGTKDKTKIKEFENTRDHYYNRILLVYKHFLAQKYAQANT
jgi:hypothetical protein